MRELNRAGPEGFFEVVDRPDSEVFRSPRYRAFLETVGGLAALFYRDDWLVTWAPLYLQGGRDLRFLLWSETAGGPIAGLLPLVHRRASIVPGLKTEVLSFWGTGDFYATNPIVGPLFATQVDAGTVAQRFARALARQRPLRWDLLNFDDVVNGGGWVDALRTEGLLHHGGQKDEPAYFVRPPEDGKDPSTFADRYSHRLAGRIAKADRKLHEMEGGAHRSSSRLSPAEFERLADLHSRRQDSINHRGAAYRRSFLSPGLERDVTEAVLQKAGTEGHLRVYSLETSSGLLAFSVVLATPRESFGYFTAISDECRSLDLGRYLWHLEMQGELVSEKIQVHHLGNGTNVMKQEFSTHQAPLFHGLARARSFRARLFVHFQAWARKWRQRHSVSSN